MQLGPGTMVTSNVRLVRPLGEGGMGSVWVADHLGLDTEVAVKFISAELAKDEHVRVRFSREAKATAQIKSPHVVQTFDHGFMPDGTPYIVMEMLHGASLADWLALEGRMRTADVAVVVSQVASALTKAHQLGIVHRDIKPANVFMIGSENETFVKVLDFGIAKRGERRAAGITETGVMVGTPEYMSPEQVLSSRDVDHRADLWALAVMAYEMLTGRRPFDGETVGALCVAVAQARFVRPTALVSDLAPEFDEFFARALAKRRTDRFQTAIELAEAFERIAGVATRSGSFAAGSAGAEDYKDKRARRDTGGSPNGRAVSAPRAAGTAIGLDARAGARARGPNGGGAGALPSSVGMSFGPGLKSAAGGPAAGSGLRGVPGALPESGLIPISVTEPVSPHAPVAEPGSHWDGPVGR
ncbi:MAG: serine/threonine protein kinase, partial [Myxococcales bacterium]|nr:serine/threonine protein kinase [Myxococcales bacterium]